MYGNTGDPRQLKQSWESKNKKSQQYHSADFKLYYRHRGQKSMVLTQKRTDRSMEQNRESRQELMVIQSNNL